MFACIYISNPSGDTAAALLACASTFSPRVENTDAGTVVFDAEGLERLFGSYLEIAAKVADEACAHRLDANVAVAANAHAAKGKGAITEDELVAHARGLICLTGGECGPLTIAVPKNNGHATLERLIGIFGRDNVYVELQRHYNREEEAINQQAISLAEIFHLPLPATNGVRYASPHQREILDVFTCIRNHRTLETAGRQIERELALIEKLGLEGYFLIVWDIVQFCLENNILIQGRGSAANSAVCYALGITAVDPVKMDLLFERFLSEERGEWPDIDLDLPSGDQRERAIQYVYQRYGALGAAMTANVITYRGRSAAREVGKVLGFDMETLDRLTSLVSHFEYKDHSDTLEAQFRVAGFDMRQPRIRKFLELCVNLQDLPRHLGQHSGCLVICQGQLDSVVPLEPAAVPGRNVVQ